MQTHFAVAHNKFLSIFDINSQQWEHISFTDNKDGDQIVTGFRCPDKESSSYLAGVVLESGKIHFVNSKTAKITDKAG